ncbi:MAG TPA: DUF4915 domain-containing protein [Planctomycetaceae bacterium]|nr:DUF4915 domain-containing protein [Planctomycetaceae bacterium]
MLGSRNVTAWLAEQQVSLAFTTYQAGKLLLVGRRPDHTLAVFERTFNRCRGLWASSDSQTFWMSARFQLWRFENVLADGQTAADFDRLYVPRVDHTTCDIDLHDLAVDADGRVVFVNTLFSCENECSTVRTCPRTTSCFVGWTPSSVLRFWTDEGVHPTVLFLDRF